MRTPDTISDSDSEQFTYYLNKVNANQSGDRHYSLPVMIEGKSISMEIDTGSSVTLLNTSDFSKLGLPIHCLSPSSATLKTYTGEDIKCVGEKYMSVQIGGQSDNLVICVVDTKGPSLLGRELMSKFKLPWQNIFNIHISERDEIIQKYNLFNTSEVEKLKDVQLRLRVKDNNPIFFKPRSFPFSIHSKFEKSLQKLQAEGIIEKVDHSEWASPTVPVIKPTGDLRICGDYSVTINKCSDLEHYPIPSIEELLHKLSGGEKYTKLDLAQAYHQLELSPESKKYTTINTFMGLFQYNRLTYGINSAVSIFQRTMENVLRDLPGCCVFVDYILITGQDDQQHKENLHRVLSRLQDCGLKLEKGQI